MMFDSNCVLTAALLEPAVTKSFSEKDWETCIRQARRAQLLARLAIRMHDAGYSEGIPSAPLRHMQAAMEEHLHINQATVTEINHLLDALDGSGIRLVLLKGAAYVAAEMAPARCRIFNDIDVLVPREQINKAELQLKTHGWATSSHDTYDEHYYRTWMHEIPPLQHINRLSVIDLHHNIVPLTARINPDPSKLLASAIPCRHFPGAYVLSPRDMVLHSAVHLFNDGEFDHGLRDLFDIHDLLRTTQKTDDDWLQLHKRAIEMDLTGPLTLALRYLEIVLGYAVPATVKMQLAQETSGKVSTFVMDHLFLRGLQPNHTTCGDNLTSLARAILYLRGHALRMPLRLLLPHLYHKALKRIREEYFTKSETQRIVRL